MGYSKSKLSVERYKDVLTLLSTSTKDVRVKSPDPDKLAYKLREAFRVAKLYPSTYPKFQDLGTKYTIKAKEDHVLLELKEGLVGELEELANALTMTFDECTTVMEIVGALVKHKPMDATFPSAKASPKELATIYRWTDINGYFINDVSPLTISRTETPESWKPQP